MFGLARGGLFGQRLFRPALRLAVGCAFSGFLLSGLLSFEGVFFWLLGLQGARCSGFRCLRFGVLRVQDVRACVVVGLEFGVVRMHEIQAYTFFFGACFGAVVGVAEFGLGFRLVECGPGFRLSGSQSVG